MTVTFNKGEFITIEAFYCEIEDGEVYEEERCEDVDTYWTEEKGDLMEYVLEQCKYIETKDPVIVDILPRKWAEFIEDCKTHKGDVTNTVVACFDLASQFQYVAQKIARKRFVFQWRGRNCNHGLLTFRRL